MNRKYSKTAYVKRIVSMIIITTFLICITDSIFGQEPIETEWRMHFSTPQPFINEEIKINVTGEPNTTVDIRFSNHRTNETIRKYGFTDEFGYWEGTIKFKLGQNGTYSVMLSIYGVVEEMKTIEVIYDEQQAQWLVIEDVESEIGMLWAKINEVVDLQNKQLSLYKKWLLVFFILWSYDMVLRYIEMKYTFPKMKEDWANWRESKGLSRTTENFFGEVSHDYRNEFPGYPTADPVFTEKHSDIIDGDLKGLTKEEVLEIKNKAYYDKHPEVKKREIAKDKYVVPKEPFPFNILLCYGLFISGIMIFILGIVLGAYLIIIGSCSIIISYYIYRKEKSKEEFAFEKAGDSDEKEN